MKTVLFTLAMVISFGAWANNSNDATDKEKKQKANTEQTQVAAVTVPTIAEYEAMKAELVRLSNQNEDLKSQLDYQKLMVNIGTIIGQRKASDELAEKDAIIAYNNLMAKMITRLNENKTAQVIAEKDASIQYGKLMTNTLIKSGKK